MYIYKTLVEQYEEPVDGKYTDATADILSSLKSDDEDSDSDTED